MNKMGLEGRRPDKQTITIRASSSGAIIFHLILSLKEGRGQAVGVEGVQGEGRSLKRRP